LESHFNVLYMEQMTLYCDNVLYMEQMTLYCDIY